MIELHKCKKMILKMNLSLSYKYLTSPWEVLKCSSFSQEWTNIVKLLVTTKKMTRAYVIIQFHPPPPPTPNFSKLINITNTTCKRGGRTCLSRRCGHLRALSAILCPIPHSPPSRHSAFCYDASQIRKINGNET